jgi:hypothetical protein
MTGIYVYAISYLVLTCEMFVKIFSSRTSIFFQSRRTPVLYLQNLLLEIPWFMLETKQPFKPSEVLSAVWLSHPVCLHFCHKPRKIIKELLLVGDLKKGGIGTLEANLGLFQGKTWVRELASFPVNGTSPWTEFHGWIISRFCSQWAIWTPS